MGGHGGLNILPQKKWNVYNYDNRAIVEKDKKEAAQKKRIQSEKARQNSLQNKLDVLFEQNGDKSSKKSTEKQHSLITQELKKINDEKKHVNLFEREQQIIENQQVMQLKKLREIEFLKDKNMDYSSQFLGIYGNEKKKPWYIKEKKCYEKQATTHKQSMHQHNRKESEREVSRSREKKVKEEVIKKEEKSEMQILRQKRLKREQKERKRIQKLKKGQK